MLQEDELRNANVLVLANKQDLPHASTVAEVNTLCLLVSGDGLL